MKHYKSEVLSIFRMSRPPAQALSPLIEDFLPTVLYQCEVGVSSLVKIKPKFFFLFIHKDTCTVKHMVVAGLLLESVTYFIKIGLQ